VILTSESPRRPLQGEYCAHEGEIDRVLATIKSSVGEVPIVESELRRAAALEEEQANEPEKPKLQQVPQTKTYENEGMVLQTGFFGYSFTRKLNVCVFLCALSCASRTFCLGLGLVSG
jgi:hypothetical protein